MKHEELLAKLNFHGDQPDKHSILDAIRAVVELHKHTKGINGADEFDACKHCYPTVYPCPTIYAIEKELK